jgi:hypothetical protein
MQILFPTEAAERPCGLRRRLFRGTWSPAMPSSAPPGKSAPWPVDSAQLPRPDCVVSVTVPV